MREQPRISGERLQACLRDYYGLASSTLDFLALGMDYQAGVYRVVSEQGRSYLLKVRSGALYEPGCLVPGYLREQGIAEVVAPLPTHGGALWATVEEWSVIVYPFIEGDTSWRGMTEEQWRRTGAIFRRIHQAASLVDLPALRRETFDPTAYARWIDTFETSHGQTFTAASPSQRALLAAWTEHRHTIQRSVAALLKLAEVLQVRRLPYVICHADLHPANLLRDQAGAVHVIDWDEVMLAPKERDFLFVKTSPTDSETLPGTPAFFEGYGPTDIDWIALTYYRYERVIQDVIACAGDVFREDLGEETRADAAALFQEVLTGGGEIEAATHALAYLPADLIPSPGKHA